MYSIEELDISDRQKVLDFFVYGLQREWDRIAGDVLVDDNGVHNESITKQKDEVVEITVDCYVGMHPTESVLWSIWTSEDPNFKTDVINKAFPYETYGW